MKDFQKKNKENSYQTNVPYSLFCWRLLLIFSKYIYKKDV